MLPRSTSGRGVGNRCDSASSPRQGTFWLLFLGRCAATSAGLQSRNQPAQQTEKSANERFQKIMAL